MDRSKSLGWVPFLLMSFPFFGTVHAADNPCPRQEQPAPEIARASEDIPHGKGLLWKIEHAGKEPSFLFGTLHLEDRRVTELPNPVKDAFTQARSFTTEVVMHPAARAIYAERIRLPADRKLRGYLDEALYERLMKLSEDHYQISEEVLSSLKPWVVFTFLSRPRPVSGRTLDAVLEEQAEKQRKSVYGLETIEEIVNALDTMPLDDQIAVLKDTICNYDIIVTQWKELIELYLRRDLAGLLALNERTHDNEALFDELMERILYQRNQRMIKSMRERLEEGGAFIGVGASHLPGKRGLLYLLESQGYMVTAIF